MSTDGRLSQRIGLLRRIVKNIVVKPLSAGPVPVDLLTRHGLARARIGAGGIYGVTPIGLAHFTALADSFFENPPIAGRGTQYTTFSYELFGMILGEFSDRDPSDIAGADVILLQNNLARWFADRAATRTVCVPCVISRTRSPRFSVGPISFVFLDEFADSEAYRSADSLGRQARVQIDSFVARIREEGASWIALIEVANCDDERAFEIAGIAADLAIAALQMAVGHPSAKSMSSLGSYRGPSCQWTLSISEDGPAASFANRDPGLVLDSGRLATLVEQALPFFHAFGNRLQGLISGSYKLPRLERGFCDAAYWLHQGLMESVGPVAVTNLEAAIEVLFWANSSKNARPRIVNAAESLLGLRGDDLIGPEAPLTLAAFVKRVIQDRSRILHGAEPTLASRLDWTREYLEPLVSMLLEATALQLDRYLQSESPRDDMDAFLSWAKTHPWRPLPNEL